MYQVSDKPVMWNALSTDCEEGRRRINDALQYAADRMGIPLLTVLEAYDAYNPSQLQMLQRDEIKQLMAEHHYQLFHTAELQQPESDLDLLNALIDTIKRKPMQFFVQVLSILAVLYVSLLAAGYLLALIK